MQCAVITVLAHPINYIKRAGEGGVCAVPGKQFELPRLKNTNVRLLFKKQQRRGSRELQAGGLHFSFWEVYGANPPENLLFQTYESKESDWEQPAWIY